MRRRKATSRRLFSRIDKGSSVSPRRFYLHETGRPLLHVSSVTLSSFLLFTERIVDVNKWRFLRSAVHAYQPGSRSTVSIHRNSSQSKRAASKTDLPVYTLTIYDRCESEEDPKKSQGHRESLKYRTKTAALFIPRGQECSWLYATPEGNQEVTYRFSLPRI